MDKLRKYIQECWGDIVYSDYDKVATLEDLEYNYRYIRFLLSTEAMFIKWLVENEKIEWNNKDIAIREWILWKSIDNYHSLLMALAIQDEPLEFLVSILK